MNANAQAAPGTWLGFELAGQSYAVPLVDVREVIRPKPPTAIPGAPADILGIINLRGTIVTVLDGCRRLGLDGNRGGGDPRLMIFHDECENVGMPIDALNDMVELDTRELEPNMRSARANDPVLGTLRQGTSFITLLDAGKLRRPQPLHAETPA